MAGQSLEASAIARRQAAIPPQRRVSSTFRQVIVSGGGLAVCPSITGRALPVKILPSRTLSACALSRAATMSDGLAGVEWLGAGSDRRGEVERDQEWMPAVQERPPRSRGDGAARARPCVSPPGLWGRGRSKRAGPKNAVKTVRFSVESPSFRQRFDRSAS
jgi:hypothetical protein